MSIPTEYTSELDYETSKLVHSNPRWTTIQCQNSAAFSFGSTHTSGSGLFELVIPSSVLNLSKSRLQFSVTSTVATDFQVFATNPAQYISRVSLSTLSGTLLADINGFNKFAHMILPMSTSKQELDTYPQGAGSNGFVYTGAIATANLPKTLAIAKQYTRGALSRSDLPTGAVTVTTLTNIVADLARHPVQHAGISTFAYDTAATANFMYFDVALGELFKHSILSLDKLMYFGESLSLQIYFDAPQSFLFSSTLPTTNLSTNAGGAFSAGSITAPILQIYNEMNMELASFVQRKVMNEGIELPFSYVYSSRIAVATSTSHTIQQTINSSLGSSLLFICAAPFQTSDVKAAFVSNDIVAVARNAVTSTNLTQYNTFIDSIPVSSPSGWNVLNAEHYRANQESFVNGCAPLSLQEYNLFFTHVDNFTGLSLSNLAKNQTQINGMSLGVSRIWSAQWTFDATIAKNWSVFWAVQRVLSIKGGRVSVQ